MKEILQNMKEILQNRLVRKIVSIVILLAVCMVLFQIAQVGYSEIHTFYIILLAGFSWLILSAAGISWYNTWSVTKRNAEGADEVLNQSERQSLQRVHQAIIVGAAIILLASALIYYGKKADEINYTQEQFITNTK